MLRASSPVLASGAAALRFFKQVSMPCGRHTTQQLEKMMKPKVMSAADAILKFVKDGDKLCIHQCAGTPHELLRGLAQVKGKYKNVEIRAGLLEGPAAHLVQPTGFNHISNFLTASYRKCVQEGNAQYYPAFLSDIPTMYRTGRLPVDCTLLSLSPPDAHGFCSMGLTVAMELAAAKMSKVVIGQINKHVPRTHGETMVHISQLDAIVLKDEPMVKNDVGTPSEEEKAVAKNVAALIPDRACVQAGIGVMPNVVLAHLHDRKDLGIHTEMFVDGMMGLIECGAVTNKYKSCYTSFCPTTFIYGSQKLYDWVNDNPIVQVLEVDHTNDESIIASNPLVHSINGCIEIDLQGQVVSDQIGTNPFSGIGGQVDFVRGAVKSKGGKSIIALVSETNKKQTKIVPKLKEGSAVTTSRGHVQYVCTEWGTVNLQGKSIPERAMLLTSIAHPSHRPKLYEYIAKQWGKNKFVKKL